MAMGHAVVLPVPKQQRSWIGHRLTLVPVELACIMLTSTAFVHKSRKGFSRSVLLADGALF